MSKALARQSPEPTLCGWGRIPAPGREVCGENLEIVTRGAVLSRGLGRSYGDSSLPAQPGDRVAGTRLANRIISFDAASGVLRTEAGFSLAEMNRLFIPRGFFTPVTPGTQFVTVGGMVASDIHGKNHHRDGCFGAHVRALKMRVADDSVIECSAATHPDLFLATLGGMGLTGHILEVEFTLARISSPWIKMESWRVGNIDEYLAALTEAAALWPMTVGWIDCVTSGRSMGRGYLMAGRWATPDEANPDPPPEPRKKTLPFDAPNWAINPVTVKLFNSAVYWCHMPRKKSGRQSPDTFFYPLDAILHWNRAYGSRGFTQYQCVLPRAAGARAVREFMQRLTQLRCASPVCVIKDCGPQGKGLLSFPLEGTSIAVDIAVTSDIQRIVDTLNEFVVAAGGRIYLTKDRFTTREHFAAMEPRLDSFQEVRHKWDPQRRFRSAQSVRVFGDKA